MIYAIYIDLEVCYLCSMDMLIMVVMKLCDTSMPKQQLGCDDVKIGLDVSHGLMTVMNLF